MWQVLPDLYWGNRDDSQNEPMLREAGITHIVNCAVELPGPEDPWIGLWLAMNDPDPDFPDHIETLCRFIDNGRRTGKVFVHCVAGVSRSPAVVLTYLCHHFGDLDRAVDVLAAVRATGIHEDFLTAICRWQSRELDHPQMIALRRRLFQRILE